MAVDEQEVAAADRRPARPAWRPPVLVAAGAGLALAYTAAVDPATGGVFLPCPLHATTGLWCPGCGLTRAVHHLLRLDLPGALALNLFTPLVVVGAVWAWTAWFLTSITGRRRKGPGDLPAAFWVLLVTAMVAYGVVRNLPFGHALAP